MRLAALTLALVLSACASSALPEAAPTATLPQPTTSPAVAPALAGQEWTPRVHPERGRLSVGETTEVSLGQPVVAELRTTGAAVTLTRQVAITASDRVTWEVAAVQRGRGVVTGEGSDGPLRIEVLVE